MAAAGERELSWEAGAPYGHGIFTYFLLQAPRRGDRNADGWVTVSEAYGYARDAIESEWNRALPSGSPYIFLPRVSGGPVDYALFEPADGEGAPAARRLHLSCSSLIRSRTRAACSNSRFLASSSISRSSAWIRACFCLGMSRL